MGAAYEAEQAAVGALEPLDVPETRAHLPAHGSGRGAEVRAILDGARAADPAEPFWTGVREMRDADGRVEMDFQEPVEPRLLPAGSVEVECHLYDSEVAVD